MDRTKKVYWKQRIKSFTKEKLTPMAIALLGAYVIYNGYDSYGTTRMGLIHMSVGALVVIAGGCLFYIQKKRKGLKK